MQRDVVTVTEENDLETAFHIFAAKPFSFLPVVASTDRRMVLGYFKKSYLIASCDEQILRIKCFIELIIRSILCGK